MLVRQFWPGWNLFNSKNLVQLCAAHALVCDTSAAVLGLVNTLEKDKNAHLFSQGVDSESHAISLCRFCHIRYDSASSGVAESLSHGCVDRLMLSITVNVSGPRGKEADGERERERERERDR